MPREYTQEEIRTQVIDHVWSMIEYWHREDRAMTDRDKLEGLAHSILVMLDGGAMALPKFIVAPDPHPADREYHESRGEDYFPPVEERDEGATRAVGLGADIAGDLHDHFHARRPR